MFNNKLFAMVLYELTCSVVLGVGVHTQFSYLNCLFDRIRAYKYLQSVLKDEWI